MNEHPEKDRAGDARAAQESYDETAQTVAEGEIGEEDVLLKLAAENEELKDRALRLAAEMENLRRRTSRDVADARAYAIANFARDMLSVSDNLRRALDAIPADAKAGDDAGFRALIEGVEMTEREMIATLGRHGVKKLEPQGERFDPNFHQAMFEVENPDMPANSVMQVVQTGYVIGERVLRPAMVGVAKGGPKHVVEPTAEPGPPDPIAEKDA
jgi:molecular chaperone GrpE